jgi:hypothetical protein
MGLNQDSNDEQQGKSRLRWQKTSTIPLVFKIEKPDQQNGRQYDDKNIQHSYALCLECQMPKPKAQKMAEMFVIRILDFI